MGGGGSHVQTMHVPPRGAPGLVVDGGLRWRLVGDACGAPLWDGWVRSSPTARSGITSALRWTRGRDARQQPVTIQRVSPPPDPLSPPRRLGPLVRPHAPHADRAIAPPTWTKPRRRLRRWPRAVQSRGRQIPRPAARHSDPIRQRHQALPQPDAACPERPVRRGREGRVRLPGRPVGFWEVHLPPPRAQGGAADVGPHPGGRQGPAPALQLEGPAPASADRHRVPGLPPAAEQDPVRERRVRPAGDRQVARRQINRDVPAVLELVGLDGKEDRLPDQLSGGEQQRVASPARSSTGR